VKNFYLNKNKTLDIEEGGRFFGAGFIPQIRNLFFRKPGRIMFSDACLVYLVKLSIIL